MLSYIKDKKGELSWKINTLLKMKVNSKP
jgi:hypothetical protein